MWFLDETGTRRGTFDVPGGHAGAVAYDTAAGAWQVVTRVEQSEEAQFHLVRLSATAQVLERSPLPQVDAAVWLDDGQVLVIGNEDGVFARDAATGTIRLVVAPT